MKRIAIEPADKEAWLELRTHDITSTEISALFGCSPYMSAFELWHTKKRGEIVRLAENERMLWGTRLEDAIAQGIADDHSLKIRKINKYVRMPVLKLGASYDYGILDDAGKEVVAPFEVKNVDYYQFKDTWFKKGQHIEAPLHIEFQLQHQMLVANKDRGYFGVLVGGNTTHIIERSASASVRNAILEKSEAFWKSLAEGVEPSPDYKVDAEFLMTLFARTVRGETMDLSDMPRTTALVERYMRLRDAASEMERRKAATAAEIVPLLGTAEKAKGRIHDMPFTITCGTSKDGSKRTFRVD